MINSEPIEFVEKAKNLGITFDKTLTWDKHINEAICKTAAKLRALWSTQHLLPVGAVPGNYAAPGKTKFCCP